MSHRNASLTPTRRLRLARCVVDDGWPLRRAAERFGLSVTTAQRWSGRYRQQGQGGMGDRSSRPNRCPAQLPRRIEHRIMGLRVSRRWGPARIGYRLRLNPATVGKVLTRYEAPRLPWTDPATGCRLRAKSKPVRYQHAAPGAWCTWTSRSWAGSPTVVVTVSWAGRPGQEGRQAWDRIHPPRHGDHSRLVYSEILSDERKETASTFWTRPNNYFNDCGITVLRVLTDNGSAYRSKLFAQTLGPITHKRNRPYRPQTNGKVERFNRTLGEEWAYARLYLSEAERVAEYPAFIHNYNHHRGHTALGGKSPADRVPNLCGQYT